VAQVPQTFFDALAVRTWCGLALESLGRAREEIDAINVYPVADGDTGTNLYLTVESAVAAVEAVFAAHEVDPEGGRPALADAVRAMAHGALIGAQGNSGTILAQLLRGMAQVLAAHGESADADGNGLRLALRHAADSARQAVARPVEGTVLTVASAAADAAGGAEGDCGTVARAAYEGARTALAATPGQLAVLGRAGVVDAGGRGLVAVLAALVQTFTGETPRAVESSASGAYGRGGHGDAGESGAAVGDSGSEGLYARVRDGAAGGLYARVQDGAAGGPYARAQDGESEEPHAHAGTAGAASGHARVEDGDTGRPAGDLGSGGGGGPVDDKGFGGVVGPTGGLEAGEGGRWTGDPEARDRGRPTGGLESGESGGPIGDPESGEGGRWTGDPEVRGSGRATGGLVSGESGRRAGGQGPGGVAAVGDHLVSHGPGEAAALAHARGASAVVGDLQDCADGPADLGGGPAFEVIYLLEAEDAAVDRLRERLDALGDSLVVVGGDGLWNVHVHVDDAGAAVEAGVEAGRPYRIRITHFGAGDVHTTGGERPPRERVQRAVVAVVPGEGLAGLYTEAGATTVLARPGEPPASGELVDAVRRAHAREVVLLPNDADLRHPAAAAAEQARAEGIRVALIPTRSAVQGIAALAVHEPERRFDEDVVSMTSAAGATRYAEVTVAERQSWTMAGICQAGDVLGLIDGDVAVIGSDVTATAETVLDRMLAAGGELVTLVLGDEAPEAIAGHLEARVRESYLAVDTVVYRGGRQGALLLIGVE
jgi:uncharacterized protein